MEEFTGSYYKCNDCKEIIDYSDSHCPSCGSQSETELNANQVIEEMNGAKLKAIRLGAMLESHDDLKPAQ